VSSSEVTSYDKILESFLIDRLSRSRTRTEVVTTKKRADEVSKRLVNLANAKSASGELQIVTGGVGVGKSLFARRYKEYLQPDSLRNTSHWSFLDFNFAPDKLSEANEWTCSRFVQSLIEEGLPLNLRDATDQERIFSSNLADREAFYQRIEAASPGRGLIEKARDIEGWRQDPLQLALGLSRHLQGDRGEVIIAVFDNVDRRDPENQLSAFQLALWFMDQIRCVVLLQMRDTTFETHKDKAPLDTYKTGTVFHISPPRFIDVVKRRLELSLDVLSTEAAQIITFTTPSGISVSYPRSRAGEFMKGLYLELFQRTNNISRVLEALAGRNVRKALDMFLAIITSGHMPEDLIAGVASGQSVRKFPEHTILKILMRQDYRFFHDGSGFISNIFYTSREWERPNNFLISEILFYLISQRKVSGDNGQMGFVSLLRLKSALETFGYVRQDVHMAAQYLLQRELIEADSFTVTDLSEHSCVKATASGWAHMRILASRSVYISSILPTTPINSPPLEARIFDLMLKENRTGKLTAAQTMSAIEGFYAYLQEQFEALNVYPGYAASSTNGAKYVLKQISDIIEFHRNSGGVGPKQIDWLDN
jgi:hypothetical protein